MARRRTALVAIVLLAAACDGGTTTPSGPDVYFPTSPDEPGAAMEALFEGPLVVRDDCVLVGEGRFTLPIWPKGFTLEEGDGGVLEVRDQEGRTVAVEGERFAMGGGYVAEFQPEGKVPPAEGQIARAEDGLGAPIPARCLGDDVYGIWAVGETEPLP